MKRAVRRSERSPASREALDDSVLEAIRLFAAILARCGASPTAMARAFQTACSDIPESFATAAGRSTRELENASHLLTVWFSDPMYLDSDGKPLPLPVRGARLSLEALTKRVDSALDVAEVVRYLRRNRALRKFGKRYAPLGPVLMLRGARGPDHFRHRRALLGILRTFDHNTRPRRRVPPWYERFAECPAFPVRAIPAFDDAMARRATAFLMNEDRELHRHELKRKPREPVARVGIGVYRFEDLPDVGAKAARKRRR
jgi:hypothetical protein